MSLLKYPGQYLDKIVPITEKRGSGGSAASVTNNIFNIQYAQSGVVYTESNARATWVSASPLGAILVVPKGAPNTSVWALEFEVVNIGATCALGIMDMASLNSSSTYFESQAAGYVYQSNGSKTNNGSSTAYGNTYTTGDKITIILDATGTTFSLSFAKNGVSQGVAYSGLTGYFIPCVELGGGSSTSIRVSSTLTYPLGTQWK